MEDGCLEQINNLSNSVVFKNQHVAIMPDTHVGAGVPIGTTATITDKAISPNFVGVDIGCGVLAVKISTPKQTLQEIDHTINQIIPMGFNIHHTAIANYPHTNLRTRCDAMNINEQHVKRSIGTLGGGK